MSKPQRSRAIRLYLDNTLIPEFKGKLSIASSNVLDIVKDSLQQAAQSTINERAQILETLKDELKTKKNEISDRLDFLRQLQTRLLILE